MSKQPIDKSIGGTFEYGEDGRFVRHIPTTRLEPDAVAQEPAAAAQPKPLVTPPTPRGTRRHKDQE